MLVRLRRVTRIGRDTFRLTLDLYRPDRPDWEPGDCVVQVDLRDAPKHGANPRGPLGPALELYRLSPGQRRKPPTRGSSGTWARRSTQSRVFEAGVLCPWRGSARPGRRSVRH